MTDVEAALKEHFSAPNGQLTPEILGEMQSIMRLHSIDPQELMYKWESYSMKMGAETTQLELKTIRDFKKDLQDILERESRGKSHAAHTTKRTGATPRAAMGSGDVFGMLDGLVPNTPRAGAVNGTATKRKSNFETPAVKSSKQHANSSPSDSKLHYTNAGVATPVTTAIAGNSAGQIQETVNAHLDAPEEAPPSFSESRIKIKSNTEMQKFAYKSMAMKLSDASQTLDDRIDEFLELLQSTSSFQDASFGNPAAPSTSEIIAVGRIASDSAEGKLNMASLVLETSRRVGAGRRVPLQIDGLPSYDFFPGQIVALRGMNASGDAFRVSEIISFPDLPEAATQPAENEAINARLASSIIAEDEDESSYQPMHPTTILVAAGPYTPCPNLNFTALTALLTRTATLRADALILLGPFLPLSHPAVRSGDFDLPPSSTSPDHATLSDLFRHHIAQPLNALVQSHPHISIILVPSVDDALAPAVAWPQDRFPRRALGLPRQAACVTNPATLTLNDVALGLSTQDVLAELRARDCVGGKAKMERDVLGRLAGLVVQQRHFFPVFPPGKRQALPKEEGEMDVEDEEEDRLGTGPGLDVGYLKLGEFVGVKPDVLVLPSMLNPFAKVVQSTTVINPGTLSKRRAPGTYARVTVYPRVVTDEEREKGDLLGNRVYERCRVDIVKIGAS